MHSASGSSQYIVLPYKVDKKPVCDCMNVEYRKFAMKEVREYSNFPYTEDRNVDICSLFPIVSFTHAY